jgi:hypothetical protein
MNDEKEFIDYAKEVIEDAEIEQSFDDRVWVSIDRHLWDAFINSVPAYDTLQGGSWADYLNQSKQERGAADTDRYEKCDCCGHEISVARVIGFGANQCYVCGADAYFERAPQ